MDWLNLHSSILDSPEVIGSEPLDRATWLFLLRYCIGQENGGRMTGARSWGDRQWQQLARVTKDEVQRTCDLWRWEGDDLIVEKYPLEKESIVRARRSAGTLGGSATTDAKAQAARDNGLLGGRTQAKPKQNPSNNPTEGKGREGKGKEADTPPVIVDDREKNRKALKSALHRAGFATVGDSLDEWAGLLMGRAKGKTLDGSLAALQWIASKAIKEGITIRYARDAAALADRYASKLTLDAPRVAVG
jgi:hypothetical protein